LLPVLIPCKHTVSDTISSPFRAAFDLSLTVLVHYRSRNVFSFGRKSSRLHTGFHESRITQEHKLQRDNPIRVPGCHRLWPAVPGRSAWEDIFHVPCLSVQANNAYVYTLRYGQSPTAAIRHATASLSAGDPLPHLPHWSLSSSPFARRYLGNEHNRNSQFARSASCETGRAKSDIEVAPFFLFLRLLRCFTSPSSLHTPIYSAHDNPIFHRIEFPHSDTPGSKVACHLTEAFRRLLRPS
jgi:hypothetical protein